MPNPDRHAFSHARHAFCEDDLATALPLLDRLHAACPDHAEVGLYAAWARVRSEEHPPEGALEAVEERARMALRTHDSLALALCILGHAALRRNDLAAARTLFRHASNTDPDLVDARRGLRLADRRVRAPRTRRARTYLTLAALFFSVVLGPPIVAGCTSCRPM